MMASKAGGAQGGGGAAPLLSFSSERSCSNEQLQVRWSEGLYRRAGTQLGCLRRTRFVFHTGNHENHGNHEMES